MRAARALLAVIALVGCGKVKPSASADGGGGMGGADGMAGAAALAPCLDRPSDLPRPPLGALPCELLPPSFGK